MGLLRSLFIHVTHVRLSGFADVELWKLDEVIVTAGWLSFQDSKETREPFVASASRLRAKEGAKSLPDSASVQVRSIL